ncbi:hypothetical protein ACKTKD_002770 [Clostridioides difficile]|nr:hypothetical protein [Clostridioides difficile]
MECKSRLFVVLGIKKERFILTIWNVNLGEFPNVDLIGSVLY